MTGQHQEYIRQFMDEVSKITKEISHEAIALLVEELVALRERNGRLFILGVGGSAGNATHAVNDFRKIVAIESYTPTDNVSELTARINDDGWDSCFAKWLHGCRLSTNDAVMVFSVGGGNMEKNISVNLVKALQYSQQVQAKIFGIVGRNGGYTNTVADVCVVVPTVNSSTITPHAEAFQSIVWHLLVSHPSLKVNEMKWESTI